MGIANKRKMYVLDLFTIDLDIIYIEALTMTISFPSG